MKKHTKYMLSTKDLIYLFEDRKKIYISTNIKELIDLLIKKMIDSDLNLLNKNN